MKKIFMTSLFIMTSIFIYLYSYADDTVSISGSISYFSSSSGAVLNDVIIKVKGTKNITVKTNRTGSYIITGLPRGGTYTLTISKLGYTFSPQTKIFRNLQESKINQNFVISPAVYSISGKVLVGGKPVRDVVVTINNRPIKYYTDQDGSYMIDNLDYNGPYEVRVVSDRHTFKPFVIDYLEEDVVHDFKKDITIGGRVTSLGYGVPDIELNINGAIYKTDDDGSYTIDSLSANGYYVLALNSDKYNPVPKSIPVRKITSDTFELNFTIVGDFSGKVTYDGKPFKNAIVKLIGIDGEKKVKTTDQGTYKFTNVGLNQEYQVIVSSKGYSFYPKERIIKSLVKESAVQNFKADIDKYSIAISAFQGDMPIQNATITLNNASSYSTDKNGVCIIKNLIADKKYTASIKKQGVKFLKSNYVIEKLLKDEEINFVTTLSISGKVCNGEKGIENAIVSYGINKSVKTNRNGEYIIQNLTPNDTYTIKVSSSNFSFEPKEIVVDNLANICKDQNFTLFIDKEKVAKEAKAKAKVEQAEAKRIAKEQAEKEEAEIKAQKEAEKRAIEEEKAKAKVEQAEAKRIAKEQAEKEEAELKAQKEAEKRAIEEEKAKAKVEQAEAKRIAKEQAEKEEAELKAQKEAEKKAAEEEKTRIKAEQAEAKRIAKEQVAKENTELKAQKDASRLAREQAAKEEEERLLAELEELERLAKEEEDKEKEKLAKKKSTEEERTRIKAEQEEAKRIAKEQAEKEAAELKAQKEAEKKAAEEKRARIKAEQEEAKRIAKEQAEREAAELKAQKEAEKKAAEEERARIKAEQAEAKRIAKEQAEREAAELKAQKEAEKKAAEEERARIKAEQAEAKRIVKEQAQKEAEKKSAEEEKIRIKSKQTETKKVAKEDTYFEDVASIGIEKKVKTNKDNYYIEGRVLKSKNGIKGVQVRLLLPDEERVYITDKNGFYKIDGLEKGENYLVTVFTGKTALNLSPKSRSYKKLSQNMKKQNFYIVEKIQKLEREEKKGEKKGDDYWGSQYGFENKDGVIQKDIHW